MDPLDKLPCLLDEAAIAEARARQAAPSGPALSHDEFMAQLEATNLQGAC
ncbi:hypothetical protein GCM10022233_11880 [Streptomyces shaanxiensis]|uniref:Uncharacterized protein n=1 Tax=Streptomyces shaanxiensis TaxID=653357 RepID=A0ABP7UIJ9_9ACTN